MHEAHAGPNMTPMVDVVMVILIFFMASAAMLGPEWFLRASLPVVGPAGGPDDAVRLTLRLSRGAGGGAARIEAAIGDAPARDLSMDEARDLLASQHRGAGTRLVVLVEPGAGASYEDVVAVHEWCEALGVARVGLVEQPAEGRR
jgi:biopolymer transport protein ExbD